MTVQEVAIKVNSEQFNKLKLLEEMHECGELLVKTMTKPKHQQDHKHLIEELGDLIVRAKIVAKMIGEDEVNNRIKEKENLLMEYYTSKLERTSKKDHN